jgi:hypothetical protein
MTEYCVNNTHIPLCENSIRKRNHASSGSIEEFIKFSNQLPSMKTALLPESACPYQSFHENEMICPDFHKRFESNPLSYKITKATPPVGIENIKNLIYSAQKPILFNFPLPVCRYYFECDLPQVANTPFCTEQLFPCLHDHYQYCAPMGFQISKPNTAERVTHATANIYPNIGHAMISVGYKDYFAEPLFVNITRAPPTRGGFILRTSWGECRHHLEYLTGAITADLEKMLCLNPDDPMLWIPVTATCLEDEKEASYTFQINNLFHFLTFISNPDTDSYFQFLPLRSS